MACAHEIHTSVSLHMPFFLSSSSIPGISAIFPPYTNCSTLHHNSQGPQIHLSTGVSIRRHIFLKRRNILLQTPNSFHQYNESFFYLFLQQCPVFSFHRQNTNGPSISRTQAFPITASPRNWEQTSIRFQTIPDVRSASGKIQAISQHREVHSRKRPVRMLQVQGRHYPDWKQQD